MTGSDISAGLPKVGVVFDSLSVDLRELLVASRDLCEVVLIPVGSVSPEAVQRLGRAFRVSTPEQAAGAGLVAITTFSETCIPRTASLAADLGLEWASPVTAKALTLKDVQRSRLGAAGVDDTQTRLVSTRHDIDRLALGDLGFPLILKPRRGLGSRGVLVASDAADVARLAHVVMAEERGYVAEQFLHGDPRVCGSDWAPYCSVETLSWGDDHRPLAIVGRAPLQENFRETGNVYPAHLPENVAEAVRRLAVAALGAIGPLFGFTHTEIMLTDSGPRIIEINGRLGGGLPKLFRLALGVELVRLGLETAVNRRIAGSPWPTAPDVTAWVTLYPTQEFVERIPFLSLRDALLHDGNVVSVTPHNRYAAGGGVDPVTHSVEVLARADGHRDLAESISRIVRLGEAEIVPKAGQIP